MTYQSFLQIALGSKEFSKSNFSNVTFQIQCWLGVLTIAYLFWRYIQLRRKIRKQEYFVDYITSSASDFTLQFSQIPIQYYDNFQQENIKQLLDEQRKNILNSLQKQIQQNKIDPMFKIMLKIPISIFSIHKMSRHEIQKHYFDYYDQKIQKNKKQLKQIYKEWFEIILRKKKNISESLDTKKLQQLEKKYKTKKKQKKKLIEEQKKMKKQEADKLENNHKDFSAFVTFNNTLNKELIQRLHAKQSSILYKLPCQKNRMYLSLPDKYTLTKTHEIIIEVAPEPEDILWSNFIFGKYKRWSRVFLTFVATMLVLTISFFLVYLLTIVQITISDETAQTKTISSTMMSFAISGVLFVVNMVIEMIIDKLTKLQRHTSYTREQTSIATKSIIAQLINTILIPIAINKIIKNNLFGVDGLADDVFYQAITFAILSPLLKVINIGAIKRIIITIWYENPWQRLKLSQKQLNKLYEFEQFQVGLEYVSVISIYLFACFYAALQPAVLGIVGFGLIVFEYAQKIYLYLFSKRPTPGNHQISNIMWYFICLGPLFFAIGNFCWTDLLAQRNQGRVANTITLIIAISIFLFPYDSIINKKRLLAKIREASFQEDRYIITSDYDRLDPLTRQQALKRYQKDKQKYWQLIQKQQRQLQIKQKLQDQKNYGDVYQQNYEDDQQSNYFQQDEQPYFQVYINIDKFHQQLEQLNQWVQEKQNNQEIRDIPYYTYYGNYGNNKLQIVQVNFYSQQIHDYIIHQNNQDQMGDNQLRNSIQCQKFVIQAHISNQDQQIIQQQSIRRERESQKRMQQTNNIIPQQKMTKDKRNARSTPLPRQYYRQPF